jgi:hypothetical protein
MLVTHSTADSAAAEMLVARFQSERRIGVCYVVPCAQAQVTIAPRMSWNGASVAERQPGLETQTRTERLVLRMVSDGKSSKAIWQQALRSSPHRRKPSHKYLPETVPPRPKRLFRFALQHKAEL